MFLFAISASSRAARRSKMPAEVSFATAMGISVSLPCGKIPYRDFPAIEFPQPDFFNQEGQNPYIHLQGIDIYFVCIVFILNVDILDEN